MIKGLLSGVAVGAVVSGLGLATVSMMVPPTTDDMVEATPTTGMQADAPDAAPDIPVEETPVSEQPLSVDGATGIQIEAPELGAAPVIEDMTEEATSETPAPEAPAVDAAPVIADTTPADRPEAVGVTGDLSDPQAGETAGVDATTDAPVLTAPMAVQPDVPEAEADVVVSTDAAVEVIIIEEDPAPEMPVAQEPVGDTPEAAVPEEETVPEAPAVTEDPAPETSPVAPAPEAPMTEAPEMGAMPDVETTPDSPVMPAPSGEMADEPAPVAPEATPEDTAEDEPARPKVGLSGEPASAMPSGDSSVTIRRPSDEAADTETADAAPNALADYATRFENPEGLPLMSVIVIDDGGLPSGPSLLSALPFPVTVALSVTDPDASAKMSAYRAAGFEVAAMTGVPDGANASDAAQAMEATFLIMPETVLFLDMGDSGLQANRQATESVMSRLASDGRGYITTGQGLNSTVRIAERAEVPVAEYSRDLDGNGQSAATIRRFLDGSAMDARRDGNTILIARLRPDTISALTLWATANRATQVALSPASAVLKGQ